jgi:hypothetical protein
MDLWYCWMLQMFWFDGSRKNPEETGRGKGQLGAMLVSV